MTNVKLAKIGHTDNVQAQAPVPLSSLLPHMKPPRNTPTHSYKPLDIGLFFLSFSLLLLFFNYAC
jgi:hypothetical protein